MNPPAFVAFDLETTGLDGYRDEIIEIGAVRFTDGKEQERLDILVKPRQELPEFITQLTGLTPAMLKDGSDEASALKNLLEFIGNDTLVCHNARFDIKFCHARLAANHLPRLENSAWCTLELSRLYLPFAGGHSLSACLDYFGLTNSNAHRATDDAAATGELLLHILPVMQSLPLMLNDRVRTLVEAAKPGLETVQLLTAVCSEQRKTVLLGQQTPVKRQGGNYFEHQPALTRAHNLDEIFGSILPERFPGWEIRPQQSQMARAVHNAFSNEEYLMAEAGTGVGKSLAYLVPAVLEARRTGGKTVVSTNTKNLQEQLFFKDIPLLAACLDQPFSALIVKGRDNYLCHRRWELVTFSPEKELGPGELMTLAGLLVWEQTTATGDISENNSFDRSSGLWPKICADRYYCQKSKCPYHNDCYLTLLRRNMEKADLLIVNHHYLLADAGSGNGSLGQFDRLVLDEAHNFIQTALTQLGISIAWSDFYGLFGQLSHSGKNFESGILPNLRGALAKSLVDKNSKDALLEQVQNLAAWIKERRLQWEELFAFTGRLVTEKGEYGKLRVKNLEEHPYLATLLARSVGLLVELVRSLESILVKVRDLPPAQIAQLDIHINNLAGAVEHAGQMAADLARFAEPDYATNALWLSEGRSWDDTVFGVLNCAPLEADVVLNRALYPNVKSLVFTSATLALRGRFTYQKHRLGLDTLPDKTVGELVVASPFDYQQQSLVITASYLPNPDDRFFSAQAADIILKAVTQVRVGTMVLFTSLKNMEDVHQQLAPELARREIPLLVQGNGLSRTALLQTFRNRKNAVLLGAASFWEGVDVQGEALSLLIVYKLPFLPPTEPIVEAYLERLQAQGHNSFMNHMLPNALLRYRQGFGRLIRSRQDRGVVLVLDNRIKTKTYGQYFEQIVPARTVFCSSPLEVTDYLGKWFKKP